MDALSPEEAVAAVGQEQMRRLSAGWMSQHCLRRCVLDGESAVSWLLRAGRPAAAKREQLRLLRGTLEVLDRQAKTR